MRHMISIYRNRDQPNEMHMSVYVEDQDYKRMEELVEAENLTATEAYDKMEADKIVKDSK